MRFSHLFWTIPISALTLGVAMAAPREPASAREAIEREVLRRLDRQLERRYMFSRARVVPPRRKVQILARQTDTEGRLFIPFVVKSNDRRSTGAHQLRVGKVDHTLTGCYYPNSQTVYVAESGERMVPAAVHSGLTRQKRKTSKSTSTPTRCVPNNRAGT